MFQAVVALGGNLGDVGQTFGRAMALALEHDDVQSVRSAERYRSVAMGADAGDSFVNSAWLVDTTLEPLALLDLLQQIEDELGRTREVRWGPRTLDLDLIFYGDQVLDLPRLVVPHPHCWYRQFVLAPVASLLPDFVHPSFGLTMRELLGRLTRNPFSVALSGEQSDLDPFEWLCHEFPRVELKRVDSTSEVEGAEVSLAFWSGSRATKPEEPFWLHVSGRNGEQFVRDILTAACMNVEPIDG
jgi:2-amino-4-hydroxy-6-hydroxymethyldihydropteridine diphosphokinase